MKEIPALLIKNLQMLNISQPGLASKLREYADSITYLKKPEIQETPSGRWISGLSQKPFFEKKQYLESRYKLEPSAVYLVFGAGCAPYLFQILRSLPREALSVIVFEPSFDLLLYTLANTSVFHALPPGCRISFIINDDRTLIDECIRASLSPIGIFPVSKAVSIHHHGEAESCSFQDMEKIFREEIVYLLTLLGNSPEDTLLGFRHGVLNLVRILNSPRLTQLTERYKGLPFISVASGPSLDKNIELLSGLEEKCVIIACDTVLYKLLDIGITPHIVTSIERPYRTHKAWMPHVLEKFKKECKQIVLVSQSVSYPLTAGRWPGPNIIVGKMDVPTDRWLVKTMLDEQLMSSGLSVAHMNLAISVICQASVIAFLGQDLAYTEDGHSHAGNTVNESILKIEQSRKSSGFKVKGALGGEVHTTRIWHTFIQIMERIVSQTKALVVDCTEGGAFINGTVVEPFKLFLEKHVNHLEKQNLMVSKLKRFDVTDFSLIQSRFEEALLKLEEAGNLIQKAREGIVRATAPALFPPKRRELAIKVSELLDKIRDLHPAIAFIGQSYTHLSGANLAESRFLENIEQVRSWDETHSEICDSHLVVVMFLKQWLSYAFSVFKMFRAGELPDWKVNPSRGEEEFLTHFNSYANSAYDEKDSEEREYIIISDLLCCRDPLEEEWSPDSLWKAARFLNIQGRNDEARRFMSKAYKLMEETEIDASVIGAFFKDWGRFSGEHDLCVAPDAGNSLLFLSNASRFLIEDDELDQIKVRVINQRREYFKNYSKYGADNSQKLSILLKIAEAEKALVEKDLVSTMLLAEQIAWESADSFPETWLSYLKWLMKTASNCVDAADKRIAETSEEILTRIIVRLPDLVETRFEFPVEFLSILSKKGIKLTVETSDTVYRTVE